MRIIMKSYKVELIVWILKKNIIMKDQELYFRYDTLYITGDRYEFKKVKKRPLGIKLRRFFSVKIVVVVLF